MDIISTGAAVAGAESLKIILNDIYDSSKSKFRKLKISRINKQAEETIYRKLRSVENVKTIWRVDEEVNLNQFYYPSKLKISGKNTPVEPHYTSDITTTQNIVIEGTAGQGKSILLRYLASNEIKKGHKIPLFIELRKVSNYRSLIPALSEKLETLGFESSNEVINELLSSGKLIVLLDGFDEIPSTEKSQILSSIEALISRYQKTIFVISSRPGSGIQHSEFFRVVRILPLDRSDHKNFLNRVCSSKAQVEAINQAICESSIEIQGLLTTPLLLTLLTILYKSEQIIPDNLIEFYNKLFYILFTKHDNSKPGFNREIKSHLRESRFEELFEHFCFLTRRKQKTLFPVDIAQRFVRESVKLSKIEADENAFLSDCCNVTCLLVEEGTDFQFIHKSVQEFYSAKFISKRKESISEKFYQTCIEQFVVWEQELKFLRDLDSYRYRKFFLVPALKHMKEIINEPNGHKKLLSGSTFTFETNGFALQISSIDTGNVLEYLRDYIIDVFVEKESIGISGNKAFLPLQTLKQLSREEDLQVRNLATTNDHIIIQAWRALEAKKGAVKILLKGINSKIDKELSEAAAFIDDEDNLEARIFTF